MGAVPDKTEQAILAAIAASVRVHGYPPTVRELCAATGVASTSTMVTRLRGLENKGLIRREPSQSRTIRIVDPGESP